MATRGGRAVAGGRPVRGRGLTSSAFAPLSPSRLAVAINSHDYDVPMASAPPFYQGTPAHRRKQSPKKVAGASKPSTSADTCISENTLDQRTFNLPKAVQVLQDHVKQLLPTTDLAVAITTVVKELQAPKQAPDASGELAALLDTHTSKILSAINSGQKSPTSYAAAAAANHIPQEVKLPAKFDREITIRTNRGAESVLPPCAAIVAEANRSISIKNAVLAARALPSKDIVLTFATPHLKLQYENDERLRQAFGEQAEIRRRGLPVVAHGVPVAPFANLSMEQAIDLIKTNNHHWPAEVAIIRVAFPARVTRLAKPTGSLIITVATQQQANALIREGLLCGSSMHDVEVYSDECKVSRCFNCQLYHKTAARYCRAQTRCGFCAGNHVTEGCMARIANDQQSMACVACQVVGHTSWDRSCPARARDVARARMAYANRPTKYHVTEELRSNQPPTELAPTTILRTRASMRQPGPIKKGRPQALATAGLRNGGILPFAPSTNIFDTLRDHANTPGTSSSHGMDGIEQTSSRTIIRIEQSPTPNPHQLTPSLSSTSEVIPSTQAGESAATGKGKGKGKATPPSPSQASGNTAQPTVLAAGATPSSQTPATTADKPLNV